MSEQQQCATDEAAAIAGVHADQGNTSPVHHYKVALGGETDCYVMGDSMAEHAVNVTCDECLEWVHA